MYTILAIDDDVHIRELLRLYIEKEGYKFVPAENGLEGLEKLDSERPDLVLLDLMLPGIDGLEVCKRIHQRSNVPVIMLTAKGETFDKVLGLELGADDYIVKPFDSKEMMARIKAVLRRSSSAQGADVSESSKKKIIFEGLEIDSNGYTVVFEDNVIPMPPKEFELLFFLASNPNKVFTREQLLEQVWGFDFFGDSRTVDVHVKRIREKLLPEHQDWQLHTVWGVGYKFEVKKS
ncbi:MAG: response regulator transcription factor [Bacillota bacterium]